MIYKPYDSITPQAKMQDIDNNVVGRCLSKHYDIDSATGEGKYVYYLSKRLTHQETKPEINPAIDAKLRQRCEKTNKKIIQPP